jgi:hypothetical protein
VSQHRLDDERAASRRARRYRRTQAVSARIATTRLQSGLFRPGRFFRPFKKLNGVTRHDRRDRVLIDELRMPVATQEHAEIIEPRHHTLQFNSVHQEYSEWNFVFTDVIEEGVL